MRALLFALLLAGCASGSTLVTGNARPPASATEVRIYAEAPPAYEVIGVISASSQLGINGQQNLERATTALQQRAAALGANGVILDYAGPPGGASDAGDREVRGRAIFVQ